MKKTNLLTVNALIAAIYTVLTLGLPVVSFGAIQFRLSEALCMLPAIFPQSVLGLTIGCFLSNLLGAVMGVNPLGFIDSVFGTLATLIAAVVLLKIAPFVKNNIIKLVVFPLPAVLFNGIIIGAELAFLTLTFSWQSFFSFFGVIALSEAVVCYIFGNLLIFLLKDKIKTR